MRGIGVLEGDLASIATGITRDGRRISGFSLGKSRVRACVWDHDGTRWKGMPLPQEFSLGAQVVLISDNGKFVAALDGAVPCLWSEGPGGGWTRAVIGAAGSLAPRAVNNAGTVVGLRHGLEGYNHAVVCPLGASPVQLQEPVGYVRSEASAVNNNGVVVGMVDGPGGSKIGPDAFVYEGGRLRLIDEGGPGFTAATAINDHDQLAGVVEKVEENPPDQKPAPKKNSK
jgi:hypothetical protein